MMIGHVRDNLPRLMLSLPGRHGTVNVEFVVDTGFDGELTVPSRLLQELDTVFTSNHFVLLADSTRRDTPQFQIDLDWNEELRPTEIIALEGRPLLGNLLLYGCQLQIDMTDGGEVVVDFL